MYIVIFYISSEEPLCGSMLIRVNISACETPTNLLGYLSILLLPYCSLEYQFSCCERGTKNMLWVSTSNRTSVVPPLNSALRCSSTEPRRLHTLGRYIRSKLGVRTYNLLAPTRWVFVIPRSWVFDQPTSKPRTKRAAELWKSPGIQERINNRAHGEKFVRDIIINMIGVRVSTGAKV